ncbi:MAG TPA: prephenate dehydratase [Armatimonadota bacterium]|nr:prephenate dehydratase [Armatimonadota bacterium]
MAKECSATNNNAMTIDELRADIDRTDEELVALLSHRAELARSIGKLKDAADTVSFVPARERIVLNHVQRVNQGPLPDEAIRGIFQQIIAASRNLEYPLTVAYFGPEYTFTHFATLLRFGSTARLVAADTISEVVDMVEHGSAHYGVVPIENSTEGVVRETLDSLYRSTLSIIDELNVPVRHAIWGSGSLDEVKIVYSHPQALAQCRNWVYRHLPNAQVQAAASTAKAAEIVAGYPEMAAICSELAADRFDLHILADHIEDSPYNRTRFSVIGPVMSQPGGRDKTSIVFSVKHQAGSLNHVLAILEQFGINMTLIESRPTKEMPWQYLFYIDLQGHASDENISTAIERIREYCLFLRILGSYPEAE